MVQLRDTMRAEETYSLEVRGLQIEKGGRTILADFDWVHSPGEIAWVVGENGAGKSSLLRILAGRERPRVGRVRRLGTGPWPHRVIYYHPAMELPDCIQVGDWARFSERITLAPARYPNEPAILPEAVLAHRRVETLSTGEAKRLALTALLRRDAGFLILDEPFEHLSREGKELLTAHLRDRARNRVVVIATNQEIPADAAGPVLHYEDDRLTITEIMEV